MAVVLSLAPYKFLPANTGGQRHIALFYKYFGQHLTLITLTVKSNENSFAENYRTVPFFADSKLRYINLLYFFSLKKIIERDKVTHVLIEHPYMGWLAILIKKFTSVKLIVRSHNIEGIRFKALGKWWWKLLLRYERFVHRQADYSLFIQGEDLKYATENFGLQPNKCLVLTYGIERNSIPTKEEKEQARRYVNEKHNITKNEKIILFVGAFNYKPNKDAYKAIEESIYPLLEKDVPLNYKIIVCGAGLKPGTDANKIVVTGFVDDVDVYFRSADVFINPVLSGAGIKTKLVEALGSNTTTVSTEQGAIGIDAAITNTKLLIVKDNDWNGFAKAIAKAMNIKEDTPPGFYHHFYWGHIAKKVVDFIRT